MGIPYAEEEMDEDIDRIPGQNIGQKENLPLLKQSVIMAEL